RVAARVATLAGTEIEDRAFAWTGRAGNLVLRAPHGGRGRLRRPAGRSLPRESLTGRHVARMRGDLRHGSLAAHGRMPRRKRRALTKALVRGGADHDGKAQDGHGQYESLVSHGGSLESKRRAPSLAGCDVHVSARLPTTNDATNAWFRTPNR